MMADCAGLQSMLTTHLALSGALVSVRFQLHAPDARQVCLIGEMSQWQLNPIPMQRDQAGCWQVSLRLRQGQWLYKFMVDGRFVADPSNPLQADDGLGGFHSYRLVGEGDWTRHPDVMYGETVRVEMQSTMLAGKTACHVLLPPQYDPASSYPVLYLLHGYRMQSNQWLGNGRIVEYMGNLLAQARIEPFVIMIPDVCPHEKVQAFAACLSEEWFPCLARRFALAPGTKASAVAGMSQFGLNAFGLAQAYPARFGLVAPVSAFYSSRYLDQLAQQSLQVQAAIRMYCGTEDYVFARNERFAGILRQNGIQFDYMRINGDHTWHYWNSITPDLLIAVSEFFANRDQVIANPLVNPLVNPPTKPLVKPPAKSLTKPPVVPGALP